MSHLEKSANDDILRHHKCRFMVKTVPFGMSLLLWYNYKLGGGYDADHPRFPRTVILIFGEFDPHH
jgi:hypothetical protein